MSVVFPMIMATVPGQSYNHPETSVSLVRSLVGALEVRYVVLSVDHTVIRKSADWHDSAVASG